MGKNRVNKEGERNKIWRKERKGKYVGGIEKKGKKWRRKGGNRDNGMGGKEGRTKGKGGGGE